MICQPLKDNSFEKFSKFHESFAYGENAQPQLHSSVTRAVHLDVGFEDL